MPKLNQEQYMSIVRNLLQVAGTFLTTYGVLQDAAWTPIAGAVLMVAPVAWGLYAHTDTNAVAVVDKMAKDPDSPVVGVVVTRTPAGEAMAAQLPGTTTVPAGTMAARDIAAGVAQARV